MPILTTGRLRVTQPGFSHVSDAGALGPCNLTISESERMSDSTDSIVYWGASALPVPSKHRCVEYRPDNVTISVIISDA